MTVLVDIGNTRIKWATLSAGKLVRRGSAVHRDSLDDAIAAFAAQLPPRTRVIAANVAGEAMGERLEALVATRPGTSLTLVATAAERRENHRASIRRGDGLLKWCSLFSGPSERHQDDADVVLAVAGCFHRLDESRVNAQSARVDDQFLRLAARSSCAAAQLAIRRTCRADG